MGALTPSGSAVSMLVSMATGELHLRGSLGLKRNNLYLEKGMRADSELCIESGGVGRRPT